MKDAAAATTESATVAVLGAGISGLAAAFYASQPPFRASVTIFDSATHTGGVLHSVRQNGFLVENSADSFIVNEQLPWAAQLAQDLGIEDQLIAPRTAHRRALVVKRGRTYAVPLGFQLMAASQLLAVFKSPLLSWRGKLRLALERYVRPSRDSRDETLAEFAQRRVGLEVFERLVQPLVGGIYTADPQRLSMAAALPQFVAMEQTHGSLTRGLRCRQSEEPDVASGARYNMFRSFPGGMQTMINELTRQLGEKSFQLGTRVESVRRTDQGQWAVRQAESTESRFDRLIVALPASVAAAVLRPAHALLAQELAAIEYAGVAVVSLGFHRRQIEHPLDAFGVVVPDIERRDIVAISFASNKFPNRAPADHVLLRVFLGGARRGELLEMNNQSLIQLALGESTSLLGIRGQPMLSRIARWKSVTPQYHVGHVARINRLEAYTRTLPNFAIAGNAYHGIGIPQCIQSGWAAAQQVHQVVPT